jgi:3-hydroxyacyl-CoA dehydrogenase
VPNPEVDTLIADAAARLGFKRRPIDRQEITERLIFPMINEGAKILEEGIAYRPGDIDVIWVYGYGWPIWRGGPMFYGDQIGLPISAINSRLMRRAPATKAFCRRIT